MSDYTSWKVDDKIVCVEKPGGGYGDERFPVVGGIYTIREIYWCHDRHQVMVRLHEVVNSIREYQEGINEASWRASRFRPVTKRPTSIAIFERIRDDPKAPIIEPAPKKERVS